MKKFYILIGAMFALTVANAQWEPQNSGTPNNLNSVYFTDANSGYIVGDSGIILKTTDGGTNWTIQSSGITYDLYSVHFTDPNRGYAAGRSDTILSTNDGGNIWTLHSSGISEPVASVYFTDTDTGYAACGNLIIQTTNGGTQWSIIYTDTLSRNNLTSIFFPDANTGYAGSTRSYISGGIDGYIIKTSNGGTAWTREYEELSRDEGLTSLYFISADTGYAVGYDWGQGGLILKTTNGGADWTHHFIAGNWNTLNSVCFTDAITGYVVGESSLGGIIFKTKNGGTDWSQQLPGTQNGLNSINFPETDTGYIVGNKGTILKTTNGGGYPAGVDDRLSISNSLKIYPNPSRDKITIETTENGHLSILTLSSQKLITCQITGPKTQLDISNLPTGIYYVRVISGSGVEIGKVVKW